MKLFDSKKALALLLSLTLGFSFIPSVFATGELSETDEIIPSAKQVEQGTEALTTTDTPEIEGANSYANEVNAYFTDGGRLGFVTENSNMKLTYSTDMLSERKVTSLTDKNGNPYLTDTMDVYVKMQNGGTYYASKTKNSAKVSQFAGLNIFRFGYYYYDVRIEDQNFVNDITVLDELDLDIENIESKLGLTSTYDENGLHCALSGNSVDPQVVFKNITFDTASYNYIAITMKSDLPATNEADCQFFMQTSAGGGYKSVSFDTVNDGEYHTYYVYLGNASNYSGTLTKLRLDFSMSYATSGGTIDIKEIKAINADVSGAPQDLGLARIFHAYSDKLHGELQFAAKNTVSGIEEVGMITNISADTVNAITIKDINGTHSSLEGIDQESIEYIGFDIKDAGIFGYILPYGSTDTLSVTLENGVYTLIQSATPEGGVINKSASGTSNANDFRMGHRLYTDSNHDFDEFILAATIERNPLDESNFKINVEGSSSATVKGYDPIRGCYTFTLAGTTFKDAYFDYPNKHFKLDFEVTGDAYDRIVYMMATTAPHGHLEGAVLMNEKGLLLPVPVQVSKNFLGDGEANLYNIDDVGYGESILPIFVGAGEKLSYTLLNLYQNWGKYPLKQLSSVQYFVPYYHLSTGVTETNCLKPWYYTSIARDHWNLPDHRSWSAPFWHTIPGHSGGSQPQHTLGGAHYFLEYTNAAGEKIITENTKNTIISSGPTYAELISDYISDDGKIKVSYTHIEMPQSDENRTYYEIKYEVLGDVEISNFKTDFSFYAVMDQLRKMSYTQIGYLDENNESQVVGINEGTSDKYYTLGKNCPYISYFNNPDSDDYVNVSFLVYNSNFTIGGEKCDAPFVLVDRGQDDMEKISLTLDLGKVTLKAGDSFTINAILMPWGSQESIYDGSNGKAPDQNVRDVRKNSLLNPFKGEAIVDCEVIESVFIPKLRTTNGKSAEFKISGGENNVAVRIYGFEKLTAPKIYEKINGEWQEYVVSSKDTSDKSGYYHYYDGYAVNYDGDGTFSYSFVTTITGGAERIFKIVADEDFVSWPFEKLLGEADPMNLYINADAINSAAESSDLYSTPEVITENGVDFVRLYGNGTSGEAFLPLYSGGTKPTGKYIVYKYRIPTTNATVIDSFEFWTSTERTGAGGNDNILVGGSTIQRDGNWHVMVIDVTQLKNTNMTFAPDENGTYSANYLRVDTWNKTVDTLSYVDVAYLGMSDSLDEIIAANKDIEYVSVVKSTTSYESVSTKTSAPEDVTVFSMENVTAHQSEEFILNVSVTNNKGLSYLKLLPEYNSEVFTLTSISNGMCFKDVFAADGYIVCDNGGENVTANGTVLSLTFRVKADALADDYTVGVKIVDINDKDTNFVPFTIESAKVIVVDCEYGDCNFDGKINLLDVVALRSYLANYDYETGIPNGNIAIGADANGDGKISLLDLALLRQYLANYNYAEESSSIVLGKVNQ